MSVWASVSLTTSSTLQNPPSDHEAEEASEIKDQNYPPEARNPSSNSTTMESAKGTRNAAFIYLSHPF